jgi:hypothetical protein
MDAYTACGMTGRLGTHSLRKTVMFQMS